MPAKNRVVVLPRAERDLAEAYEHIRLDNPAAARATTERVRERVLSLADFPEQGRPGRRANTPELVITGTPYIAVCRVRGDEVRVVRVLHGARDPQGPA